MIGLKAGRNGHNLLQAQAEQARAGQENEGERDLRDDEAMPQALRGDAGGARSRFQLKRVGKMAAKVEPRDRSRNDDSQQDSADEADQRERIIERDVRAERQAIR